ncbi:MAG: SDR family oxidoreductase, partial [Isosphaeraceae bacterium]
DVPGALGRTPDVRRTEDIEQTIDCIGATCGGLNIVVNNPRVNNMAYRVKINQLPRSKWGRIQAIDLMGLYDVSQFAARAMRSQGLGADHQQRLERRTGPIATPMRLKTRGIPGGQGARGCTG